MCEDKAMYTPLCGTVLVLSSEQSAGIPNTSMVIYGSVTSPFAAEPFGFGKFWPLIILWADNKP